MVYGLNRLDRRGRIAFRAIKTLLGWVPGTQLGLRVTQGAAIFSPLLDGPHAVNAASHLFLSCGLRRRLGLEHEGTQVLLAADSSNDRLVLFPVGFLESLVGSLAEAESGDL
ncbi:hypothetical protein HDA40_001930 [Hamadaea flava]|uniref:Uncharacterized protein n=1 Tax=Hamadaea flava TaxID=1742688 RepID=A0ABV8LDV1_9ACTN|nr:hypothetical protein [Hamadaea flava]MCP2323423.1 hypothetical protein [Hamadaea flava]